MSPSHPCTKSSGEPKSECQNHLCPKPTIKEIYENQTPPSSRLRISLLHFRPDFDFGNSICQNAKITIKIRDFVYSESIKLNPATLYPFALIAGEKGLLAHIHSFRFSIPHRSSQS